MNESDFRDWARAALRSMDEKLERLAREKAEPAKPELDKQIQGEIVFLVDVLAKKVKAGEVAGVAIAFVNAEGRMQSGFAAQRVGPSGYFALAGATTFLGLEILEDYRKSLRAANENAEEATA
jgi:hypothetical protein